MKQKVIVLILMVMATACSYDGRRVTLLEKEYSFSKVTNTLAYDSSIGDITLYPAEGEVLQVQLIIKGSSTLEEEQKEELGRLGLVTVNSMGVTCLKLSPEALVNKYEERFDGNPICDLEIRAPGTISLFQIDMGMGDFTAKGVEGAFTLKLGIGNIEMDQVAFTGLSDLAADMGDISVWTNGLADSFLGATLDCGMGDVVLNLGKHKSQEFRIYAAAGMGKASLTNYPLMRREEQEISFSPGGLPFFNLSSGMGDVSVSAIN